MGGSVSLVFANGGMSYEEARMRDREIVTDFFSRAQDSMVSVFGADHLDREVMVAEWVLGLQNVAGVIPEGVALEAFAGDRPSAVAQQLLDAGKCTVAEVEAGLADAYATNVWGLVLQEFFDDPASPSLGILSLDN